MEDLQAPLGNRYLIAVGSLSSILSSGSFLWVEDWNGALAVT